ncbi:MAG TPA: DUF362 domain-containing protein, partial [Armatimonadota bacterium]|nr:DUF362 domain-containing protein [Armatimonadota bacterium]
MSDHSERPMQMTLEEITADMERLANEGMDRRQFLKQTARGAIATLVSASVLASPVFAQLAGKPVATPNATTGKSRVVLVKHPRLQGDTGRTLNPTVLNDVMTAGLCSLTGAKTLQDAWKTIVKPEDNVAIKWNELGGLNIVTYNDLKAAVKNQVIATGVAPANVLLWGRPPAGQIPEQAKDFGPVRTFPNGTTARITNGLEQWATSLISLPVVKMHWGTQMTISMKLHYGSVQNPGQLHGNAQAPMWQNIAYLNAQECIKNKTRLIIADAVRPQWNDGPGDKPQYRWDYNGFIFGTDPVAVDAVGCAILEKKRQEVGLSPATDAQKTLALAQELVIGKS